MGTRVSIIFPYSRPDDEVMNRLTSVIGICLGNNRQHRFHTSNRKPVLVVNNDTIRRGHYEKYKEYLQNKNLTDILNSIDVEKVWSVDTCQMWLSGFGRIINDKWNDSDDNTSSILQIPGDLKYIENIDHFMDQLVFLRTRAESDSDFAIGDFDVEPQKSKHLIDLYGTYPFLYNWFPDIAKIISEKIKIKRPRSEFIAAKIEFLEYMLLNKRKFAYEQTLALLIHAISENKHSQGNWAIHKVDLGKISDFDKNRGFREAVDQTERTLRLLKLLWREMNGGDNFDVDQFNILDMKSTSIRQASLVSFENFLKA